MGVAKALFQHGLLPTVVSGTSSGSLTASWLGAHTDDELKQMLKSDLQNVPLDRYFSSDSSLQALQLLRKVGAMHCHDHYKVCGFRVLDSGTSNLVLCDKVIAGSVGMCLSV